jgi:CRP/FNR family cyclic AMP-dependent transcriptional regulator
LDFSSFFEYPDTSPNESLDDLVFLADKSPEEWAKLLAYTETRRFQAGDVIIHLGEIERSLYLVTEGNLQIYVPFDEGQTLRPFLAAESGSIIGEQSFFDGLPRSAMVQAATDGELMRLSLESFEVLAAREPALAHDILFDLGRILSVRLRQTSALVTS